MTGRLFARALAIALAVCTNAKASDNAAAGGENDPAIQATALLEEARELLRLGTPEANARACPKLEESVRALESLANTFNLAQCYELTHRLASAWYYFGRAGSLASRTNHDEAQKVCNTRRTDLEPKLGRIAIIVSDANRVSGMTIHRGAIEVGKVLWSGTPVPADQGAVRIEVSAPGHVAWSQSVRVEDGATTRVEIPTLAKVVQIVDDGGKKGIVKWVPPLPVPKPKEPQRTLAWVAAASAAAGLGVGIAGLALREGQVSRYNDDARCLGTESTADPDACKRLISDGATYRAIATVGFVAASVLAATSAVLFISSSPKQEARTSFSCGPLLGLGAACALKF